jgi:hypothetical protein
MAEAESSPGAATWESRNMARAEGTWFLRHRATLSHWPILSEPWARKIEDRRLSDHDPSDFSRLNHLR